MKYGVIFESFTERHFIKTFAKKYKGAWDRTLRGLELEFTFADLLFEKSIAETVADTVGIKICKTEFKIAGTETSRHGSGNRCIIAIHRDVAMVHILLVYCKTDVRGARETDWWQGTIRDNYPQYSKII